MGVTPSASYSVTLRVEHVRVPGTLAKILEKISEVDGSIGAIDIVQVQKDKSIRDFTVDCTSFEHAKQVIDAVKSMEGVNVRSWSDRTFLIHLGGKIEIANRVPVKTRDDLSMAYTPGVGRVCMAIHHDKEKAWALTIKKNMIAVVSDGTAVLGLGDIGPEAAMPVMEGKAMLFKEFGGVDAFPICLDTKDPDKIVEICKMIAPTFGGINLEDISAPRCFYIEDRLKKETDIPIFHDDQHGTAVVVAAALINALKITGKKIEDLHVVVAGVGAAGVACTKMLMSMGVSHFIGCDRKGIICKERSDLGDNFAKQWYAENTNQENRKGTIHDAMKGADLFLGLSGPGIITLEDVKKMNKDPIVFAMSNPVPEIMPEEAWGHVAIMATGRSDYPNQINNVLCFPGIMRGALDARARDINEEMKQAAARAIASSVTPDELGQDYIIPTVFNRNVPKLVAREVAMAAMRTGVARREIKRDIMEIEEAEKEEIMGRLEV
ncbi:MAG: NAD-dependent malic enzyme [bacterium]|jgi:malate dehydrogenase (oxaloacetate-decarboxylating)